MNSGQVLNHTSTTYNATFNIHESGTEMTKSWIEDNTEMWMNALITLLN